MFELAKADNKDMSSSFYEIRNDVLVRRARDRISTVGLEVTQIVVPSALYDNMLRISHHLPTPGSFTCRYSEDLPPYVKAFILGWHAKVSSKPLPNL